ncbi:hypothetical protein A2690_00855 [Candidatus Roizmanbacteria bacterium RIFCSPHIGHO2_01_FULL_39_12b]|uniref:Uncharacterized protein n=1 Tax=Candidatus Roizmanbacteria bacterium RIFCSPHIGHO2_01_FULL_39_12b TaxID=1802030 RepID=A0A1F7GAS0_9BACT|nr:MAG: hypothetical protein A2690_00855 [Candidatus Roizmanbacteria bacterium RIFCSPHIGHO2_01_FULL_39_12b]
MPEVTDAEVATPSIVNELCVHRMPLSTTSLAMWSDGLITLHINDRIPGRSDFRESHGQVKGQVDKAMAYIREKGLSASDLYELFRRYATVPLSSLTPDDITDISKANGVLVQMSRMVSFQGSEYHKK